MRLPSHNLPKSVYKKPRTVKHKDSKAKKERKEAKLAKTEGMDVVSADPTPELTDAEKESAKMERKKANAHKVAYKKVPIRR